MFARRVGVAVAAAVLGTVLVLAGLAWACTNFVRIDSLVPATNSASTTPTAAVRGSGAAAGATVELRWNGIEGPVIGRAKADQSGAFSAEASIPDVSPGIYTVIANDGHNPVGRAAIEVGASPGGAVLATPAAGAGFTAHPAPGFGSPSAGFPPQLGITILAVGLGALASGFALVTVRRRRALAAA